mmetsp:Transcript_1247/g.3290  ORF Transcript_1247/g.3290 Transcript_1247/m.3290 type:complete len:213 (-) Transcript_1247:853-1491(-)
MSDCRAHGGLQPDVVERARRPAHALRGAADEPQRGRGVGELGLGVRQVERGEHGHSARLQRVAAVAVAHEPVPLVELRAAGLQARAHAADGTLKRRRVRRAAVRRALACGDDRDGGHGRALRDAHAGSMRPGGCAGERVEARGAERRELHDGEREAGHVQRRHEGAREDAHDPHPPARFEMLDGAARSDGELHVRGGAEVVDQEADGFTGHD